MAGLARPKATVRDIASARALPSPSDASEVRTVSAQLRVTAASLARLLSVTGSYSDFMLSSADGATTIRVELAVSSVPDGELVLGNGGIVLDWSRSTITRGAQRVSLTRMELRLLCALMEYAPGAASREQLASRLWPSHSDPAHKPDMALPVWICGLRRRLASLGLRDAIETVRHTGYRLSL